VNDYQTQKITPQNGHVEPGLWRLSHGKSEYKYRHVSGKSVFWHNGKLQTLSAVRGDFPCPNLRLSNIIRTGSPENFFASYSPANFGEECSKEIKDMEDNNEENEDQNNRTELGIDFSRWGAIRS
jgi:hypothetical protein